MLDNFQGFTNGNDTGKTPLQDMLAAAELWCKDIEARLQETGVSHKVNTDNGKSECQKAAQIESDIDYLKRRHIRWQRLNRSVKDRKFPVSMLSFYCEDTVGNYNDDDINNLSHYMEYNDNYDDK